MVEVVQLQTLAAVRQDGLETLVKLVCITAVINTHNFLLLLVITVVGIHILRQLNAVATMFLTLVCIGLNIGSCQFSGYT